MIDKVQQTINNEPTAFTIRISSPGVLRIVGIRKVKLRIRGLYMGTLLKISPLLLKLKIKAKSDEGMIPAALDAMEQNIELQSRILAMAILNGPTKMRLFTRPLAKFLMWNLDATSMSQLMSLLLDKMNIMDFMTSIVLTGGLQIQKSQTSLASDTGETIAPGSQLDN